MGNRTSAEKAALEFSLKGGRPFDTVLLFLKAEGASAESSNQNQGKTDMKKVIRSCVLLAFASLLAPQPTQAQGTGFYFRGDIGPAFVRLRGTKRTSRTRDVPIVNRETPVVLFRRVRSLIPSLQDPLASATMRTPNGSFFTFYDTKGRRKNGRRISCNDGIRR